MQRGKFIVCDGLDGSGTTTQVDRLAQFFRGKGHEVLLTKEPSTGPVGVLIRQQLSASPAVDEKTLALLFAADRVDHLKREVLPALERGALVICDRYILSSLAYQTLHNSFQWVQQINGMGRHPYYIPADLTFFFDISPELAQERIRSRAGVVERFDALHLQRTIADGYEQALVLLHEEKVVRVDASKPIEELTLELVHHLQKLLA